MNIVAKRFLISAALYGLLALFLGLMMAISQDHSQLTTHAHLVLIGWVSFAIFAIFYHLFSDKVSQKLANLHFWISQPSLIGMVIGLLLIYGGNMEYEFIAAISSITYTLSFIIFVFNVFSATKT